MEGLTKVQTALGGEEGTEFVLAFIRSQAEIAQVAQSIASRLEGDTLFWMAYPKKSSKKYDTDISRDEGWEPLGQYQLEPVRQVAIDKDWSALRFRKVAFIKRLKRDQKRLLSEEGKKKKN